MIPNYWWYLFLLIFGMTMLIFTFWKNKEWKRLIQTYFFITGLSYIIDFIVLVLLKGYQYKPNLVDSHWFDSTFGSIFSQGIAVPLAGMLIAGLNLSFSWILLIAMMFMGLEELFLSLGIYEQHWWKTWYTGALLIVGFYFAKVWYHLLKFPSIVTKFITIYMTLSVYVNTLRFFMVLLFSTHFYSVGWFTNPIRDHIAGNALMLFVLMILITTVIVLKFKWYWILSLLIFEWGVDSLLIQNNVLHLAPYFEIPHFVLLLLGTILIFRFIYVKWFVVGV